MKKIQTQVIIRNAELLDFVKSIVGVIVLFLMFMILCYNEIDGYLIYAVVTYTAFLSGMGWALFFEKIVKKKIKPVKI